MVSAEALLLARGIRPFGAVPRVEHVLVAAVDVAVRRQDLFRDVHRRGMVYEVRQTVLLSRSVLKGDIPSQNAGYR